MNVGARMIVASWRPRRIMELLKCYGCLTVRHFIVTNVFESRAVSDEIYFAALWGLRRYKAKRWVDSHKIEFSFSLTHWNLLWKWFLFIHRCLWLERILKQSVRAHAFSSSNPRCLCYLMFSYCLMNCDTPCWFKYKMVPQTIKQDIRGR